MPVRTESSKTGAAGQAGYIRPVRRFEEAHMRTSTCVRVALAVVLTAVVANAQTQLKPGFNLLTPDQDVELGQQSAIEIEAQLPIISDAATTAYVDRIGQRLAAKAGGYSYQYHFKVVNASDINAFALPGGFVYVNRGILSNAHNEGEVAGVMAHEIAHVALRHGTHQVSKQFVAEAGLTVLEGITLGHGGLLRTMILDKIGTAGLNAAFLKNSRENESDADVRGCQILAAAGYSPADMVNFYRLLEKADPTKRTNFASDHPAPPDRIARIQKEAQLLQVTSKPTENVAELTVIQARLNGLGPAETMKQIQEKASASSSDERRVIPVPNVPAPSEELKTYTHPAALYRVSYPSNWIVYESKSTGVTIAPPGGICPVGKGRSEIVYGAIINRYQPIDKNRTGSTLESATEDLIAAIEKSSPHLRVVGKPGMLRVSGAAALSATLRGTNPATATGERVTIVTRELSDGALGYLLLVTPEKDADAYRNVLQTMVGSMQISKTVAARR